MKTFFAWLWLWIIYGLILSVVWMHPVMSFECLIVITAFAGVAGAFFIVFSMFVITVACIEHITKGKLP